MITEAQIKPDTPVVCSKDGQFAKVDHMEGKDTIKLKKDKDGQHHYIPLSWVKKVDDKIHIDRPGDQAMRDWSTSPPASSKSANASATNEGMRNSKEEGAAVKSSGAKDKDQHTQ